MKFQRVVKALAASAVAAVVSFAALSSAQAHEWMYTDDNFPGGRVDFWPYGDVVKVCDIQADDHAVYISVEDYTQHLFKYSSTVGGNGNCKEYRASMGAPYDLREGNVFLFWICLVKGSLYSYCDSATWLNVNDMYSRGSSRRGATVAAQRDSSLLYLADSHSAPR